MGPLDDEDEWETSTMIPKLSLAQDISIALFVISCNELAGGVAWPNLLMLLLKGGVGQAYLTSTRFTDQSYVFYFEFIVISY